MVEKIFRFRDGPLRVRPPEEIVYGTGRCALGPVLVASSNKGIVTIMIRDKADQLLRDLRSRFPKAILARNEEESRDAVVKVIEYIAAPFGRFGLPLDMRGTDFQQSVWREVRKIPIGQTSSYSKIAAAIGSPRAVRAVGSSCTHCWFSFAVPCHRVLRKGDADRARHDRRDARRYRWVEYEANLLAKREKAQSRRPLTPSISGGA